MQRQIETRRGRTARGQATRARIVDAAARLVRTRGVGSTSLDAVLAASHASKSQLYHYFAGKDDLMLAVILRQTDGVLAMHEPLLRGMNSFAALRRWRDAVVESSRKTRCAGGCPLGSLVSELAESPQSRERLAQSFTKWKACFIAGFRTIRGRDGKAPRADLDELATGLLAALQ